MKRTKLVVAAAAIVLVALVLPGSANAAAQAKPGPSMDSNLVMHHMVTNCDTMVGLL